MGVGIMLFLSILRCPLHLEKHPSLLHTRVLGVDGVVLITSLDPIKNVCDAFPPQSTAFCTHLWVEKRKKDCKLIFPST